MALASTMVFEVRPGSGSDTQCSGGFNSARGGTDYTLQAAAQATGTASSSSTTVTATTSIFTSVMVGNTITSNGTNVYEITAYTSGTQVTVDSAPSWTSATVYVGGARQTIKNTEALLTAGMVAWIKADGTNQTISSTIACVNSGDMTSGVITWQGYHSTRGDHDGTRPLITTSTNNLKMLTDAVSTNVRFRVFDNIEFQSTAVTPGYGLVPALNNSTSDWTVSNCKIDGHLGGILGDNSIAFADTLLYLLNTEITNCTDALIAANSTKVDSCYIHGNSGYGIKIPSNAGGTGGTTYRITNTIVYSNNKGIYALAAASTAATTGPFIDISSCAIVSNTNDGIQMAGANGNFSMLALQNCIIYGNGGYGVNLTNTAMPVPLNHFNAYGSNTTANRNNLATGTGDVSLTSDPFNAKGSGDFTLNATAGGGASCRRAGFPGAISFLNPAGQSDIGVYQHGYYSNRGILSGCAL